MRVKKVAFTVFLVFVLFSHLNATLLFAKESDETFSRYKSSYKSYVEAIEENKDAAVISKLAEKLRTSEKEYQRSIGINVDLSLDSSESKTQILKPNLDVQSSSAYSNEHETNTITRSKKSALQKKYEKIIYDLSSPDRGSKLAEIKKDLEEFIATCTDPILRKEMTFQLADITYDLTGDLEKAQSILTDYAINTEDKESARQAKARIKVLQKKAIVEHERKRFREIQQKSVNKWGSYSKLSWFAAPVKIWKLGEYAIQNMQRKFIGKSLEKALEEYDEAVMESYPLGSTDELTRSRLIPLNSVRLLINGRTSYHYRFERAKKAQSSIYFQTLLYQDDETGNKLADIMIERAQNGVDVRLILDDFFSFNKKAGVIQRLKNGGVKVMINNPILKNIFKANFRSHQKLFIIDEIYAIVGGMNTGDEYAKGEIAEYGWRDTDVELQGPVVNMITNLFERNWEDLTIEKQNETGDTSKYKKEKDKVNEFKPLKNADKLIRGPLPVYFEIPPYFEDVNARFVITTPISEKDDNILDLFEIYLKRSKSEVVFQTGYFIPTERLVKAIEAARARGVSVKIITNSIESNNHPYGGLAGRATYKPVLACGAQIFEWRGAQTLHSKISLFDDFAVTIGAYNINSRSHSSDSEDVIALEDSRVAKAMKQVLLKDIARCQEITLSDALSWDEDFMEKAKMNFFSLFKFIF